MRKCDPYHEELIRKNKVESVCKIKLLYKLAFLFCIVKIKIVILSLMKHPVWL